MIFPILTLTIFVSAILHIRADYYNHRSQTYIFKPLTILLIISLCLLQSPVISTYYKYCILIGLIVSLLSDIFLMLPTKKIYLGMAGFLVAHICYTLAFTSDTGFNFNPFISIPLVITGIVYLKILMPHSGSKAVAIIFYTIAILTMFWQALERMSISQNLSSTFALIGATLFVLSDSIWAYNQFVKKSDRAQIIILSSYYCAQWFIAVSVQIW